MQLMAKEAADRPESASVVAERLCEIASEISKLGRLPNSGFFPKRSDAEGSTQPAVDAGGGSEDTEDDDVTVVSAHPEFLWQAPQPPAELLPAVDRELPPGPDETLDDALDPLGHTSESPPGQVESEAKSSESGLHGLSESEVHLLSHDIRAELERETKRRDEEAARTASEEAALRSRDAWRRRVTSVPWLPAVIAFGALAFLLYLLSR